MKTYEFALTGFADLFFSKRVREEKQQGETDDDFEKRTWQEKVHRTDEGQAFIPSFAVVNGLVSAAMWRGEKIKGKGGKTYTQRFRAGVFVPDGLLLYRGGVPITIDDIEQVTLFVRVNQKSENRVDRIFPLVRSGWEARGTILVFDDLLNEKIVASHFETLGMFIGFGAMRVENGGINGRFRLENITAVKDAA